MDVSKYNKKQLLSFYEVMYKMRRFEEEVYERYKLGQMVGIAHLYIGEEAVGAGVCATLEEKDYIGSTHRGHGHLIARGADLNRMMAEILGRATGYSGGKGGSMHIMAMDKGILGANGIVGGEIPIAVGAAYKSKYKDTKQVVASFFGDGAANEGTFHESINMAAAWDLPVVFVIENNLYGISVDTRDVTNTDDLADRAKGYGIPGHVVDGMDVLAVYEVTKKAVERARKGEGPSLIECKTYRFHGHHGGDPATYRKRRSETEKDDWIARCPIINTRAAVIKAKKASEDEMLAIEDAVEDEVQAAVQFALDSPWPPGDDAFADVFV